jgi:small redox-active disulfide protein 2
MQVKVLGAGCANCHRLEDRTKEALALLDRPDEVQMVTDFAEIARLGVMTTPALMVDGAIVMSGRVPELAELQELLAAV